MLTSFRSHIKGWIAWVFVILVSVPFALWGVSSYRSVITSNYVAKVNGQEISPQAFQRAYQNAYRQRQTALGGKFNPTPAQEKALKQQVLDQLITQTLLREQAANYHMVASEADVRNQINQIPAFQLNGKFSFAQYQAVLAANGMSPDQFEARVRTDLKSQILQHGLAGSAFATPQAADALIGLVREQRKVAWLSVPLAKFKPGTPPSDEAVTAYYQAHKETFTLPTSVTISYVQLDPKTLEAGIKTDGASLKDWYRTHQSDYGTPPARKAAEILIEPKSSSTAAVAAAKAQAEKLAGEVRAAPDAQKKFAALARKASDDAVSRRNGGSIGYVGRGQMPKLFDEALFGIAKVGEIAGPIQTPRGWVLIQLLDKRAGQVKPYADVKDKVKQDYLREQARNRYFKLGDRLANIAYENPGSLAPIAKALGLKIQTVSGVTRDKGSGIAQNDKIREAAFSDPVFKLHQNSEPVKLGDINAVVLRVSAIQPSRLKPLDKVRGQVVAAIENQRAEAGARAAIAGARAKLHSGKTLAAVAASLGVPVHGPVEFTRAAPAASLPTPVAQAAFAQAVPAEHKRSYGTARLANGDPALFALLSVTPGTTKQVKQPVRQAYLTQLAQLNATQAMTEYLAWLRAQADIKIIQKNIP